jgi:carboxyl-terminal processing protease
VEHGKKRFFWYILIAVSVLLIGAAVPYASAQLFAPYQNREELVTITKSEYERYQKYAELERISEYIDNYFYTETDFDTLLEGAKRGMVAALDDPYSFYYSAEQFSEMKEGDEGDYTGIGIQISSSYVTGLCTITRPFEGSPAETAGLRKGDILATVEDIDVSIYTIMEAMDVMRGSMDTVGEPVHLSVLRGDEILEFDVMRGNIHINRVSSMMLDGGVGYIILYEFAGDCAASFKNHLDALVAQGMKALIFDLRDNPGGWVDDAVDIAGNFIDDDVVVYLENREGQRQFYYADEGKLDIPMVILMNEYSASSSEIIAGALQDYGIAKIVGVQSFGKGIVQSVFPLHPMDPESDGMQITSAVYYTPNGNSLHKVGLTPDVEIAMPEGEENTMYQMGDMNDVQFQKAYEVALSMIAP